MAEITETLLQQKLDRGNWNTSYNVDNFKEEKELTVEITLAEYRNLIKNVATSEYEMSKKNKEISDYRNANEELKRQVTHLEEVLTTVKSLKETEKNEEAE